MTVRDSLTSCSSALKRGDEIVFRGFGRFTSEKREARTAFDPRTREPISVPEKIVAKFKPYGELVDLPTQEED